MRVVSVINEFISKGYQDRMEDIISKSELPLYFNEYSSYPLVGFESTVMQTNKTKENIQFTHQFVREGAVVSSFFNCVEPLLYHFLAKDEAIRTMNLQKIKLNLNPIAKHFAEDEYFTPHIDNNNFNEGITAIYYINDSDGDTLFFDSDMNIVERITPQKGTLVYFNNQIFHAGQPPQNNPYRAVINFNWIKE